MSGMFNIDTGVGMNNKMNCDTSCWACEFQDDGSDWASVGVAESACIGSDLGYCEWTVDSSGTASFNGLGWCDFPQEMEDGGAKDCNFECEGCNFMNNPQSDCENSMANDGVGCKWVSEGDNNYCVDKTKKTCGSDCFSCYTTDSCQGSALSCSWENGLCQPQGFEGEVCFDGVDNDNDNMIDCNDPDCGFDNFCGGSSFGGDCFAQTTQGDCNQTVAFDNLNCTWINDTWNPEGWCDMPGANCWKFDNDMNACGLEPGCTNDSSSLGGSAGICDINKTKVDMANCWEWSDNETCNTDSECQWVADPWCAEGDNAVTDPWCMANNATGWCDYKPFATCMGLEEGSCNISNNCIWNQDEYSMQGGWCDVACFNWSISTNESCMAVDAGLCEWKDMSQTCQPEMFMMMGAPNADGKTGCWQYNGNETACGEQSVICEYKNDSYANNNVSENEPSGWCMDKAEFEHFGGMEGEVIDLIMDSNNIGESHPVNEVGIEPFVDLLGIGMKVSESGFDFGAGVYDISDALMCNGYMVVNTSDPFSGAKTLGVGDKATKFYWYLDTNGNSTDGCEAQLESGVNVSGFDFMVNYISRNSTNGIVETKQMMRCFNNDWVPTNALVTTSKKIGCGDIGGVMIAIAKQDLESFSEYDKKSDMRILMTSADELDSRTSPSDSVGPAYYTPGSIDFGFIDCSDPTMSKDPKCKNFQKFGFNVFEECKNGIDDDENGLVDCDDPFCLFIPDCAASGAAFNFVNNEEDKTAPTVVFSEVKKLHDAAFVRIDTNEPSNLDLSFYGNLSGCLDTSINVTLSDSGEGYQANANFKPFHSIDLMEDTLNYSLINNTVYYYKITVCDPSSNCAVSECSNFTTKATAEDKSFVFKMDLPDGYTVDIPVFNKTGYSFTENFSGVVYDVGIKTNTSVTKNMNMTFHCGEMSIGFFGINLLSPTKIDLSNAFVCDAAAKFMGMNSTLKKWNKLIDELHLGGATDYIEITMPVTFSSENTLSWTNDGGLEGEDVDAYVECRDGGNSNTICKIPVSMGFSAYTVTTPTTTPTTAPASSTGGGGGGGAVPELTEESVEKIYSVGSRYDFSYSDESHSISINGIVDGKANITIASDPTNFVLGVGESATKDLDDDGDLDVYVEVTNISTDNKVTFNIKALEEVAEISSVDSISGDVVASDDSVVDDVLVDEKEVMNRWWIWVSSIGVIVIVVIFFNIFKKKRNNKVVEVNNNKSAKTKVVNNKAKTVSNKTKAANNNKKK